MSPINALRRTIMAGAITLTAATSLIFAPPAFADAPATVSAGRLQNVRMLLPDKTPTSIAVYFTGREGWTPADDAIAGAMTAKGTAVLAVDLPGYAARLDDADGECLYVVGEITDLAQTAERQLAIETYLPPIVVGRGEGATLSYAALADAPPNTLGGAVATGFSNRLQLRLPFCPGATAKKSADGKSYSYGFDKELPEAATLFVAPDDVDAVSEAADKLDNLTVTAIDPDATADQVAETVADLAGSITPFGDLPAVDLPSTTPPKAIAILVSGDGGWRDLDKTIGEWLSTRGIHVVGVDALHYFWSKRTPEELARDITSLVGDVDTASNMPVMLIGYSFGADTIPFAYPLLPDSLKDRTRVIALMGPSLTTSFQVTISGWLGIDDSGYDVPKAIAALPSGRTLCVYGREEDDSGCTAPATVAVDKLETEGGHHFDGNYPAIAQHFLDRLAASSPKEVDAKAN